MLKNNRVLSLLLVLLLMATFAFTACSSEPSEPVDTNEETNVAGNQEEVQEGVLEAAALSYFADMTSSNMMKADEFIEKLKGDELDAHILDIRAPEDYEEGHIKGAVNIPYGKAIAENLESIPKDKPIMVYCYSGQTASQTMALLRVAGFDAINITSGWNGGISQVEGYEKVVETTSNEFPEVDTEVASEVKEAIAAYYSSGTNYKISPEDVKKYVDEKNDSVVFLDIRAAEDYEEGHIEGAVNLPFGQGMQEGFVDLPKDKTIIVICYSGQTADQTNAILNILGYDALGMSGGMNNGWLKAEFPVVTQ